MKASFFSELKRRNVYKVAVAYAVVGWLLVQVTTQVFPIFEIPNWALRLIVLAIIIGFPVALMLAWAFELTPEGLKRTEDVDLATQPHTKSHAWIYVAVVAGAISVSLFFLGRYTARNGSSASSSATLEKSIAVLPFESLSDDKANAYFATGIQDEIMTRLAKIAGLKVISRTSTQQYQSKPGNLTEIAKQLGVANILEGSVQKAGEAVHINVQLIKAATDEHLWAESYDRELKNIFGVEGEVAGAIAQALKTTLTGSEEKAITEKPTQNVDAYNSYLRGLSIERTQYSYFAYQRAADAYAQAVQSDPKFAQAWARLAVLRSFLYFNSIDRQANSAAAV